MKDKLLVCPQCVSDVRKIFILGHFEKCRHMGSAGTKGEAIISEGFSNTTLHVGNVSGL
jgi:hypothetical protein